MQVVCGRGTASGIPTPLSLSRRPTRRARSVRRPYRGSLPIVLKYSLIFRTTSLRSTFPDSLTYAYSLPGVAGYPRRPVTPKCKKRKRMAADDGRPVTQEVRFEPHFVLVPRTPASTAFLQGESVVQVLRARAAHSFILVGLSQKTAPVRSESSPNQNFCAPVEGASRRVPFR